MSGEKEMMAFLGKLIKNLETLETESGKTTMVNGTWYGPARGTGDNLKKKTVVSRNSKEATEQSDYESFREGKVPVDEDGQVDMKKIDEISNKVADEETKRIFDGLE